MSNMSYCRFENTISDVEDCVENMELDEDASKREIIARERFIELCVQVAIDYGHEIGKEIGKEVIQAD